MWDGYYTRFDCVAQDTYPFWTRPAKVSFRLNQRRPVHLDDASDTASLTLTADALLPKSLARRDNHIWFAIFRLFIPLLPVDNQSLNRG